MKFEESLLQRETSLSSKLLERQTGVDDKTGKGLAAECITEEVLLRPFLPPAFDCCKGAIVNDSSPSKQSHAIDRVIYDKSAAQPLIYDSAHSIFPIEIVAGMVEITMRLDAAKLKADIERMAPVKHMIERNYIMPDPQSRISALHVKTKGLSPRSFIVGLPADPMWDPVTIAQTLRKIQRELGPPTHVHGLYVIGIGFFFTIPVENDKSPTMYQIAAFTGPERIFKFTDSFRTAFDRWPKIPQGWSVNLTPYVPVEPRVLAE